MAESVILSDGTTDYEFVYNASTQPDFKVHYGLRVEAGDPDVLWHRPDDAPPRLVRMNNQPRTVFLTKDVYGDDWDDIMNTLAPIKRWVDGDDQQAARYHTVGDVDKIYCRIQLDGMTNYTDATVIYGNVDDSGSFYKPVDLLNKVATGVVVMLVVEPLGEGAPITLRNDLASSPHFLQDSNADGIADGWTGSGTPSTVSISGARYLIGGKSQRAVTDNASSHGFVSSTVTATISSSIVAYIWITEPSGGDSINVKLQDGTGTTIQEKTIAFNINGIETTSVSDKTAAGGGGETWYRVVVSGTNSGAANASLRVYRASGNATQATQFYIDGAYLYVGSTTAPAAFASTAAIQNRYDPTGTSAATEARINYLDAWGVPGDSDAIVDIATTITTAASNPYRVHVSRIHDGIYLAATRDYWFDSLVDGNAINGSWSTTVDANRSGGSYIRLTSSGGAANATFTVSLTDDATLRRFLNWTSRVFVLTRSSNINSTVKLNGIAGGSTVLQSGAGYTVANTWEWVDLGMINPNDSPLQYANTGGSSPNIQFGVTTPSTGITVDVDAVIALPITDDGWLVGESVTFTATDISYVLGSLRTYFSDNAATPDDFLGSAWTCKPSIMNRYTINISGGGNAHALTNAFTNTLTIVPRTRHLLGTT